MVWCGAFTTELSIRKRDEGISFVVSNESRMPPVPDAIAAAQAAAMAP